MKYSLQKALSEGRFGLEKESLRVNKFTLLPSVADHPFGADPTISRDFCEAQTEIITPVCENTGELMQTLHDLNERVKEKLAGQDEILWNYSNPPAGYEEKQIRIAHFQGDEQEKETYRRYLRNKYGISRMLLSGIHFNFSFTEDAIASIASASGGFREEEYPAGQVRPGPGPAPAGSRSAFSDRLYLKLAAASMKYAWLITFLTAASPVTGDIVGMSAPGKHGSATPYAVPSARGLKEIASVRCSEYGYWNSFIPVLDYTSLEGYIDSIQSLVDEGKLYSAWELYLPVRLKPRGANTLENLRRGISHIELRMLDLNPLEEDGIRKEDVDFLHLLLMMWAVQEPVCLNEAAQRCAVENMQRAARLEMSRIWIEEPGGIYLPLRNAALQFLARMDLFYETWKDPEIFSLIQYQRRKILDPNLLYAHRILKDNALTGQHTADIV